MQPFERIPVFVKGNTLLPLAEPVEHVATDTRFEITVHIFGDKPEDFVLYEDDGVTFDFARGLQNRLVLKWDGATGSVQKTSDFDGPARYRINKWTMR